jgi:hypothetical protein
MRAAKWQEFSRGAHVGGVLITLSPVIASSIHLQDVG